MKHIFISHSWITQLLVESIIDKEELSLTDVIILNDSYRKFNYYVNSEMKDKMFDFQRLVQFKSSPGINITAIKYIYRWLKSVKNFNKRIFEITNGQQYKLYVPHLNLPNYKILKSNPECIAYYYIEEGILSYKTDTENNLRFDNGNLPTLVRFFVFFNNRFKKMLSVKTIDNDYTGAYSVMPFAFPGFRNVIDVLPQFKLISNKINNKLDIKNLFILANYQTNGKYKKLEEADFIDRFKSVVDSILEYVTENIYYKHHPSTNEVMRNNIDEILKEKGNGCFIELADDICIEAVLARQRPHVYTFNCTLAVYAYILECKLSVFSKFILPETDIMFAGDTSLEKFYVDSDY